MAKPPASPLLRIGAVGYFDAPQADNGDMRMKFVAGAGLALAAILAGQAVGQAAPTPDAQRARAEAIFKERCKDCHDPAVERAPSREELAAKPPEAIVAALTTGPMTPVAEGLTAEDKQAIAAYLTGR